MFKDVDRICSDFVPSITNQGLCTSRNGDGIERIFRQSNHLSTFKKAFHPKKYKQQTERIEQDRTRQHFTFVMDRSTYKDMKRGMEWNQSTTSEFKVSIHSPHNVADIRGWVNQIFTAPTGLITTIKITPSEMKSETSVREIDVKKRNCRFSDESDDLNSFKWI